MVTEDPGRSRRVPVKASAPMPSGVMEEPRVSEVIGAFWKALLPIVSTELPIVTDVSCESLKESCGIVVMPSPMTSVTRSAPSPATRVLMSARDKLSAAASDTVTA